MIVDLLIVVAVVIVAFLVYASTRPNDFTVQRALGVNASAENIFPLIDDFHEWSKWSPWERLDPAMHRTFSGAPSGPGAIYEWTGNRQAGQGRMEILEAARPSRVQIKLDFIKPFEGHNLVTISMAPSGGTTNITWHMTGPRPFLMKVMGLFMNMDKMVGTDFERGLANIKSVAEQ